MKPDIPTFNWTFEQAKKHFTDPSNIAEGHVTLCVQRSSPENIDDLINWAESFGWNSRVNQENKTILFLRFARTDTPAKPKTETVDERIRQEKAYKAYQAEWMRSHGYSPRNLVKSVFEYLLNDPDTIEDLGDMSRGMSIPSLLDEIFDGWERDSGFGGSIWACMDEFLNSEYKDKKYVNALLKGTP